MTLFGAAARLLSEPAPHDSPTIREDHDSEATEAPAGFKTPTLGENPGGQSESNGMPPTSGGSFADDQAEFEEAEGIDEGLGPVYNARSCTDCHQNPVTGGSSQVTEFRAGHFEHRRFVNPTVEIKNGRATISGRSLINDRAICPQAQERVPASEDVRTFRMSLSVLGDGFVEAIDDSTLIRIAEQQRAGSGGTIAGQFIQVPILEAPGETRIGRFGWKTQHASLLSFAADAYLNEQGITSRLLPTDTTDVCKTTSDPEDEEDDAGVADIDRFASFIRATLAPPRNSRLAGTREARAGERIFSQIGCAICHVPSIVTAPAGTALNGGLLIVPPQLGNKIIHPYSDFLLHDVGTGDGIVQNGPAETANKLRTPPLWGLRTRTRLMHDGLSATVENAIRRHDGEASEVIRAFRRLSDREEDRLLTFLNSL
jgi:CxxC motif-containing protein (DUF1111 family)